MLAQTQNRLLGTQRAIERIVLPVADRTKQDGIGILGQLQRTVRQRMAMRFVTSATDWCGFHFKFFVDAVQYAYSLVDDLGTDAVAGQNGNLHVVRLFNLENEGAGADTNTS